MRLVVSKRGRAAARTRSSLVEKARLGSRSGSSGRLASGNTYNSQNRNLGERRARHEDPVGGRVQIRRRDLKTVVEEREQVVGNDAFKGFAVGEPQFDPKAVQFGAAQERFALRLEFIGELANEIDRPNPSNRDLDVFSLGSENVNGVELAEACRVQVTTQRFLIGKHKNDLLVSRGWGFGFQNQ